MDFAGTYDRLRVAVDRLLLGEGLRAKATRGGVWVGGGSVAEQASRFARNMILTRLLAPSSLWGHGDCHVLFRHRWSFDRSGSEAGGHSKPEGRGEGVPQRRLVDGRGPGDHDVPCYFCHGPLGRPFLWDRRTCLALLRVTLLSCLFDGAMSPRSILAQKEMKFGRWMAISNGGAICGVILTVILSFVLRDVWALAIGFGSENAFRCLLSYILYPGLPSLALGPSRGAGSL